jgi:hypothetical protein
MTFDPNGTYEFAWDYEAYPVWVQSRDSGAQHVRLDPTLEHTLQEWSDRVTDAMSRPNGPDAPGWDGPSDEILAALDAEGAALAVRFQEALGPSAVVEYQSVR